MLALVVATVVVALMERKAQAKARAAMAPQPLGEDPSLGSLDDPGMGDDTFGDAGMGTDDDAFAGFDETEK